MLGFSPVPLLPPSLAPTAHPAGRPVACGGPTGHPGECCPCTAFSFYSFFLLALHPPQSWLLTAFLLHHRVFHGLSLSWSGSPTAPVPQGDPDPGSVPQGTLLLPVVGLWPCPQLHPLHPSAPFLLIPWLPLVHSNACPAPCTPWQATATPTSLKVDWNRLQPSRGSSGLLPPGHPQPPDLPHCHR